MNEADRTQLAQLKEQQARLENDLRLLSQQLRSLEQRLLQVPAPTSEPVASKASVSLSPAVLPRPVTPAAPPVITVFSLPNPAPAEVPGRPEPARLRTDIGVGAQPVANPGPAASTQTQTTAAAPELEPVTPPTAPAPLESAPVRSFEMRLGTFWLVRVGVVMVLTGLVFFGNLAYQNYISKLGAGGKVSLLYLASAVLLGAGWWWQRRAVKDALRNYAQVLFAGGLGALYFTTYAAHHLERLQVIRSAWLDGLLLLGCAGLMVWAAERKRSELLAFFAVGLAYYTSIITRVGYFTLWSNLVLSVAAVFFLVRNRWAALSFGGLAATYASYGFWRFFDGSAWHWASPQEGLWSGTTFLILYWAVFTTAVFLSRDKKFAGENRASFLTLNNGAFFTLFLLTMLQVQHGGFWRFSLIYGGVLLGLSALAGRALNAEPLAANTYLTQGLLLITVGLISKFAGLQLALILGVESVLLLVLGQQRKNLVLLTGAYISAALAVFWGMDGMKQFDTPSLWLGVGLGVLMMSNALLTHRNLIARPRPEGEARLGGRLRPQPSYFVVLALAVWFVATWNNTAHAWFPLYLAIEALLLSFSVYLLGIAEVTLFGQAFLIIAYVGWFVNWLDQLGGGPWWSPVSTIGVSLGLSHWWPAQTKIQLRGQNRHLWPAIYGLGISLLLYCWLVPRPLAPSWIVTTSLLALGLTIYGVFTRAWFVAVWAQLFLLASALQFGFQLWNEPPTGRVMLAPIGALVLLSFGTVQWFRRAPAETRVSDPLLKLAQLYRWVALAMSIAWVCEYVPARERIWIFALLGMLVFGWAGLRRNREALLFSAAYTGTALVLFWLSLVGTSTVYFPNLLVILLVLGQRQVARRFSDRYPLDPGIHQAAILVGALSLWVFISRWVMESASGFYLTASWSLLALGLFGVGLLLRERMYRWVGLGVLAFALGRVVFFDVWKLQTVYQILSFMALGIVLLVLGFIYSKYQEKIREWL
jgi:uncharacterized membrane protein